MCLSYNKEKCYNLINFAVRVDRDFSFSVNWMWARKQIKIILDNYFIRRRFSNELSLIWLYERRAWILIGCKRESNVFVYLFVAFVFVLFLYKQTNKPR